MKLLTSLFFILIIFSGCISDQKNNAADQVTNLWQAEESTIGITKEGDTGKGIKNTIQLTLSNLKVVDSEYSHKNITSTSALIFLQNLEPSEYNDIDEINIIVKSFEEKYET